MIKKRQKPLTMDEEKVKPHTERTISKDEDEEMTRLFNNIPKFVE